MMTSYYPPGNEGNISIISHLSKVGETNHLESRVTFHPGGVLVPRRVPGTLKLTANVPKIGWLEYDRFLLGRPIFRSYVSFREGICFCFCSPLFLGKV